MSCSGSFDSVDLIVSGRCWAAELNSGWILDGKSTFLNSVGVTRSDDMTCISPSSTEITSIGLINIVAHTQRVVGRGAG